MSIDCSFCVILKSFLSFACTTLYSYRIKRFGPAFTLTDAIQCVFAMMGTVSAHILANRMIFQMLLKI